MDATDSGTATFAERFCAQHQIDPQRFATAVVRRTLHLPMRWLAPIWLTLRPATFEPDLELALFCGHQRSARDLEEELHEFHHDSRNYGLLRGRLKQRLSTRRLRRLHRRTMRSV
ncbi:hypothetical protein [Synoicihabitans lomoniglobus]|uniref:Uncharacterized protein n=1 Tax=Synoicihabitans lomoniglobus TaxID=2909285 RepID=A0AAF0CN06_9BACT|nr:hypothetical protein [Opitutaceae bacterium LMO-M01]WED64011.1 hypothetical protein PXH66_16860 [Opitutaceae bacterium LMO-M01]